MERQIVDITPSCIPFEGRKRVASYARVSCEKDAMLHSLAAQIDYYRNYVSSHPEWEFAGIYADEAKTGTKDNREQFQKLLSECRAGHIDMVITKSISRLARNTVTLLSTLRELKELNVNVFFEDQGINSISDEGELLLTILASQAQEESISCSDNCKWRIRKGFEQGQSSNFIMLGYKLVNGRIVLVPNEAAIVEEIYNLYLSGYGPQRIANRLNEHGISTEHIKFWRYSTIRMILRNEKYVGDLLLQKTLIEDALTKKQINNDGQLPQYYVRDDHKPVISRETYAEVHDEIYHRAAKYSHRCGETNAFTGKIRCGICGKNYRRGQARGNTIWRCGTYNTRGKKYCASKAIPEETLKNCIAGALGGNAFAKDDFVNLVDHIIVETGNILRLVFKDGTEKTVFWKDHSRSESWSMEMRESARQKALERRS